MMQHNDSNHRKKSAFPPYTALITKQKAAVRLRLLPDGTINYGWLILNRPLDNLIDLKPVVEILAFLTHMAFHENQKRLDKIWLFFGRKSVPLTKHCLSCIFITNLFWREYMTMQGVKNIAKILLLPWQFAMYLVKHKCTAV